MPKRYGNADVPCPPPVAGGRFVPYSDFEAMAAIASDLLANLQHARKCIAWCRKQINSPQLGDGIPVEAFIDAAIANAKKGGVK